MSTRNFYGQGQHRNIGKFEGNYYYTLTQQTKKTNYEYKQTIFLPGFDYKEMASYLQAFHYYKKVMF
jgi:hypothetical protein